LVARAKWETLRKKREHSGWFS